MHIALKQLIHTFFYEDIYTPLDTYKLFVGKRGGKYHEKYYFLVVTDEDTLIMDKVNIKVMDQYSGEIEAIDYSGTSLGDSRKITDKPEESLSDTMKGLEDGIKC